MEISRQGLSREETRAVERARVARIGAGDQSAAREFYDEYCNLIYSALHKSALVEIQDVEDVFNDFFVHLSRDNYKRLLAWSEDASLSTYIYAIMKNFLVDRHRSLRNNPTKDAQKIDDVPEEALPLDDTQQTETGVYFGQLAEYVKSVKRSLSERDREIICRRFYKDEEPADIASALGITTNNFYVAAQRAEKRLVDAIKSRYPFLFEVGV